MLDGRTQRAIQQAGQKLGLDVTFVPAIDYIDSPSDRWTVFEVYEKGEDSEPVGIVVSDGQTYQWRRTYGKLPNGAAGQYLAGAKALLMQVANGLGYATNTTKPAANSLSSF